MGVSYRPQAVLSEVDTFSDADACGASEEERIREQIVNAAKINNARHSDYVIADGIVVIPKDAVIPPGTVI